MTVSSSIIADNTAGTGGGGIVVLNGLLQLTNSTVSGNVGREGGGIYYSQSGLDVPVLEVTSSTITLNRTTGTFIAGGGGISINTDSLSTRALIRNTIIAGNQTALRGPDVDGPVLSLGYNLIGQTDGSTGWIDMDLQGTSANPLDPLLGPLQDNGGPTPTHALLVGSPAIDTGDPAAVGSLDQRGVIRGIGGTNIGAYQASAFVLTAPAPVTAGTPFDVTVTAVDSFGQTAFGYTGTVSFTSTDATAMFADNDGTPLPGNRYTFTATDAGTPTFSVVLTSAGLQSVTVTDSGTGVSASQNVQVNPGAAVGFEVLVPISPVEADRSTPVIVTVVDAYGNEGPIYMAPQSLSAGPRGSAIFSGESISLPRLNGEHPDAGGVVVHVVPPQQVGQPLVQASIRGKSTAAEIGTNRQPVCRNHRRGAATRLVLHLGVGVKIASGVDDFDVTEPRLG
jgi:hypothetical protein